MYILKKNILTQRFIKCLGKLSNKFSRKISILVQIRFKIVPKEVAEIVRKVTHVEIEKVLLEETDNNVY